MERRWWKEAVGYQIYPRSFYDSNGDGIGDLNGVIEKLDYLAELGVDLIWLCPVYDSPMDDNGYDVADYFNIAAQFGTLDDMKALMTKAKSLGIRVIMDLVLNHTSDEHKWFIESRSSKDNKYRDYYVWREGKMVEDEEVEPTNWASMFTPSAWEKCEETGEYYLHLFSKKMPDLNWQNKAMRQELYEMAKWWIDLGLDGFRMDAINHIEKEWSFEDSTLDEPGKYKKDYDKYTNLEGVHDYLQEMNQVLLQGEDIFAVGELGGQISVDDALKYTSVKRKELDMVFTFDHCFHNNIEESLVEVWEREIYLDKLKKSLAKWQNGLYGKGWVPLNWLNHDLPRVVSQYGSLKYHKESAKMLATALYFMWGTPFIYNGEEIGMTNVTYTDINDFIDVQSKEKVKELRSLGYDETWIHRYMCLRARDNARSPMQWTDESQAGFTTGEPWQKVNENYVQINVKAQQEDEDSILNYYKKVIALRKNETYKDVIVYGKYKLLKPKHKRVYTYTRTYGNKTLLVVVNFFEKECSVKFKDMNAKSVLLSNYEVSEMNLENLTLRPYEAIVFEVN